MAGPYDKFEAAFEQFQIVLREELKEEVARLKDDVLVGIQKLATEEPISPTKPPKEFEAIAKIDFSHFCGQCGFEFAHEKIIKILQNRDVTLRHIRCPKCKHPIKFRVLEVLS